MRDLPFRQLEDCHIPEPSDSDRQQLRAGPERSPTSICRSFGTIKQRVI